MSENKNEKPTPKKIEDARKKGQVAVSRDLARLLMFSVVAELALATESIWRESIDVLINLSLRPSGQPFYVAMMEMVGSAGQLLMLVFGIFFVVCSVLAVVGYWGQYGVLIAPKALTPKFDKLNPVNGAKQLFSKRKLSELAITVLKAALIALVSYVVIRDQLPDIVRLARGEPKDIYYGFIALLRSTFHIVLCVCAVLALTDFATQKYFHIKTLMMDMEEIKREYKESEGDPLVKGMRKQLARQWSMTDAVAKTESANAVVVNPTHFAVAMLYDTELAGVPVVLAKGKDEVAQAMIQRARECGIPVIRHVWLARTLYATCRADTVVPKSSYEAVADVYAVVQELRETDQMERLVELENSGEPP